MGSCRRKLWTDAASRSLRCLALAHTFVAFTCLTVCSLTHSLARLTSTNSTEKWRLTVTGNVKHFRVRCFQRDFTKQPAVGTEPTPHSFHYLTVISLIKPRQPLVAFCCFIIIIALLMMIIVIWSAFGHVGRWSLDATTHIHIATSARYGFLHGSSSPAPAPPARLTIWHSGNVYTVACFAFWCYFSFAFGYCADLSARVCPVWLVATLYYTVLFLYVVVFSFYCQFVYSVNSLLQFPVAKGVEI